MQTPYATPPMRRSKTGMVLGIIGTVLGGLGLCAGTCGAGYIPAIIALILGIIGLVMAKNDERPQTARILGIVSIVLAALTIVVTIITNIFGLAFGVALLRAIQENELSNIDNLIPPIFR